MPDALLIDLDGVLRTWDPRIVAGIEAGKGIPLGSIADAAFSDSGSLHRAVTGAISDEEWRHGIASRLAGQHGEAGSEAVRQWSHASGEVDHQVLHLVRRVRRAVPVALVTNATTRLGRDLAELGLAGEFDVVVNSAELGIAKPDRGIFTHACSSLGTDPSESLFVDDTTANIDAAQDLGLNAHLSRPFTPWLTSSTAPVHSLRTASSRPAGGVAGMSTDVLLAELASRGVDPPQ